MELLEARGIPSVRGNHDRFPRDRPVERLAGSDRFAHDSLGADWIDKLYNLPTTIDVNADVYAVHGTPTDDETYLLEDTDSGRMAPARRWSGTDASTSQRRFVGVAVESIPDSPQPASSKDRNRFRAAPQS